MAPGAPAKDRALIAALQKRYSADPKAERATLDGAFADAMKSVAEKYPGDDTIPSPARRETSVDSYDRSASYS